MIVFALIATVIYRYFTEEKEKAVLRKTFEAYFPYRIGISRQFSPAASIEHAGQWNNDPSTKL